MKAQLFAPIFTVLAVASAQNSFAHGSVVCTTTQAPAVTVSVAIGDQYDNANGDSLIYGYKSHAKVQIQTATTTQVFDADILERTISTRLETGSSFVVELGGSDKMYFSDVEIPGQEPSPVKGGLIYKGLNLPVICKLKL